MSDAGLCFVPNRLERRRADTYWKCPADEVIEVRVRSRLWLTVETSGGQTEAFRVLHAADVAPGLADALGLLIGS